jgi:hypothetical protein
MFSELSGGCGDSGADVAVGLLDALGHQREVELGVGLAFEQLSVGSEPPAQVVEVSQHAVVGEQPAVLLERMGVLERRLGSGGVPDVGQERGRANLSGIGDERLAAICRHRLAVDQRRAVGLERAEADAVGLCF